MSHDGKITVIDPETGKEVDDYVIDSFEDYKFMLGQYQMKKLHGFEVTDEVFEGILPVGVKAGDCVIVGTPPVHIYRQGTMDKNMAIDQLSIDDVNELRANKARRLAKEKENSKEKIKKQLGEL